eukprot:scaffold18639_cov57-Phaeocystis_antarctica.AAC.7
MKTTRTVRYVVRVPCPTSANFSIGQSGTSIDPALLKSGLKLLQRASYCLLRQCGPAATSWRIARVLLDRGSHLQLMSISV